MIGTVQRVTVTFADGRTEVVKFGAAALVQMERRFRGRIAQAPIESAYYGAWWVLGRPGVGSDPDARFDAWLETVDAIETLDEDEAAEAVAADPTQPTP